FSKAGSFWWQATYSGDTNNTETGRAHLNSSQRQIKHNHPSMSKQLSESTGGIGDSVHDTSSLSGATSNAGGTVSYAVYTNNTCTTLAAAGDVISGQLPRRPLSAVFPYTTLFRSFSKAGSFWWQATYSGDTNNT